MSTGLSFMDLWWRYKGRHVILPKDLGKSLPSGKLLSETEWRALGVQQSRGWSHYCCHR